MHSRSDPCRILDAATTLEDLADRLPGLPFPEGFRQLSAARRLQSEILSELAHPSRRDLLPQLISLRRAQRSLLCAARKLAHA